MILERLRPLGRHLGPLLKRLGEGNARWQALSARDRLAVASAAIVMVLALTWLVFARPALETVAHWQRDLPKLRAQSAELDQILSDVPAARGQHSGAGPSESPQAGLDRAGLQGRYRVQVVVNDAPAGTGKAAPAKAWRIQFDEPVPAASVFPWLLAVSARADLEVVGAVLDRADNAAEAGAGSQGHVRGVVNLQSTSLYKDGP